MGLEELLEQSLRDCEKLTRSLEGERSARAQAERLSRTKDEFLSALSHELRTPLNAILGWTQILSDPQVSPDELKDGLATIERNARVQVQLVDDLLDVSRMISGRLRLDVQHVDLRTVINAAIAAILPSAQARQIRLETHFEDEIPPVAADPARLQQIAWNLLSNSIKFTRPGGRIAITLRRAASQAEITIEDTGEGIAPDLLPYLFDRFRQASPTRRRAGGLGIGLTRVHHLVELHGGTVAARSAGENQGATFTVAIPLAAIEQPPSSIPRQHPASPLAPASPGELPSLQGTTILVIDDEPDARELLRRVLERQSAMTLLADGAWQAIDLLKQHRPHLIVSDIGMPGLDGYEMMRQIRALPPDQGRDIPAIALTAFARSEDRRRALLAGFQIHMAKPIEAPELIATVASLLGRSGVAND